MDMTGVTCSSTLWELNMHGKMLKFRTYSKRPDSPNCRFVFDVDVGHLRYTIDLVLDVRDWGFVSMVFFKMSTVVGSKNLIGLGWSLRLKKCAKIMLAQIFGGSDKSKKKK